MSKGIVYKDIIEAIRKLREEGWIFSELEENKSFNPSRRHQTWVIHQNE